MAPEHLGAVALTASIENEVAIRNWLIGVRRLADEVEVALDRLVSQLGNRVHVSITLHRQTDTTTTEEDARARSE